MPCTPASALGSLYTMERELKPKVPLFNHGIRDSLDQQFLVAQQQQLPIKEQHTADAEDSESLSSHFKDDFSAEEKPAATMIDLIRNEAIPFKVNRKRVRKAADKKEQ